jgi:hypothetical protein
MESNDSTALSCIGWAIEKYLDTIPSQLKPTFRKTLEDVKIEKFDWNTFYSTNSKPS